jgi:stage V sporulation protein D (sporulation-specific penicillin-binding protein)
VLKNRLKKYTKKVINYLRASSPETNILLFFWCLFWIIVFRIVLLQVVQAEAYQERLIDQHYTRSSLQADRWNIFVTDKSWEKIQLTNNINLYTLYVDPKFIVDKDAFIQDIAPVIYDHFCTFYELEEPTLKECLEHVEKFTKTKILPNKKYVFYTSGDTQLDIDVVQENEIYAQELEETLALASSGWIYEHIVDHLYDAIKIGIKERNYLWNYVEYPELIKELDEQDLPYIEIVEESFVYVIPGKVSNKTASAEYISSLFEKHTEEEMDEEYLKTSVLVPRENRYVRLVTGINALLVSRVTEMKEQYRTEWLENKSEAEGDFPRLHGLWLETSQRRYYPYDTFMSHLIWYVDATGESYYGTEEFHDELLAGKDGKIVGLATPWIGQVWSNNIVVEKPKDGSDVYLTIDPIVQKELESLVQRYHGYYNADSIAVTVLDPHTGKVTAMINYPTFNPNDFGQEYKLQPLTNQQRYLIEDDTRVDLPLYKLTGDVVSLATTTERDDLTMAKYYFENLLGPQVFVNKNISYPYEPGSVFKSLTLWIWVDSDSIDMYEMYNDPGSVQVGQFTIANIEPRCTGDHTFLHALAYSCNVGMVRIAQSMMKYVFYSYLEKLWFGKLTGIELANEESGTLPDYNIVSKARFFNNTYGQWILTTPLQMAAAYASLVNGGRYIAPTIVENVYDKEKKRYIDLANKKKQKVFTSTTSDDMRKALVNVVTHGGLAEEVYMPGYSLGGKTWTSEIAYQWVYRKGEWRTNTSFVGIVTASDLNHVVAIQVRRPRSSQRWLDTAGRLFYQIAEFLLAYDQIER